MFIQIHKTTEANFIFPLIELIFSLAQEQNLFALSKYQTYNPGQKSWNTLHYCQHVVFLSTSPSPP